MRLKKLSAVLVSIALTLAGILAVATPASAVGVTATASPSSFAASSTTQAFTITVPSTAQGLNSWNAIYIQLASTANVGWGIAPAGCPSMGAAGSLSSCNISSVSIGGTTVSDAVAKKQGSTYLEISRPLSGQSQQFFTNSSSNEVVITFLPGTFNVPAVAGSGYVANVSYSDPQAPTITAAPISVTSTSTNHTVTFNANGGTGTMNDQVASSATALTANAFTNSGYSFGGWATSQSNATAGTVAYANGASFPFTSSQTLYAIWTANGSGDGGSSGTVSAALAETGSDLALPLGAGTMLLVVGAALIVLRCRKSAV